VTDSPAALGLVMKIAFVAGVVAYAGVAVAVAGAPRWSAPWLPQQPPGSTLAILLPAAAFGAFALGFFLGRRPGSSEPRPQGNQPWTVTRFVTGAASVESGALLMLALSILGKDSRWAILGAGPAAVILLLAPLSEDGGRAAS
jgi:hypothetical protein